MSETISASGSCLCGKVTLTASKLQPSVGICHCSFCRNWGGGPLMAVTCGSDVTIEGTEHVSVYDSSEWAERGFCKACGTHLFYRIKENQGYHVPVGLFDGVDFRLESEIFIDEKPEWYEFANTTKKATGAEVFAMFASQK